MYHRERSLFCVLRRYTAAVIYTVQMNDLDVFSTRGLCTDGTDDRGRELSVAGGVWKVQGLEFTLD